MSYITSNIIIIISIIGSIQGYFLAIFLFFHRKGNKKANRLLAFILFCNALSLDIFLVLQSGFKDFPFLFGLLLFCLQGAGMFLFPPLHFLYIKTFINPTYLTRTKHLLFIVPFVTYLLIVIPNLYNLPYHALIDKIKIALSMKVTMSNIIYSNVLALYGLFYMIISCIAIIKYQKDRQLFKNTFQKEKLSWLIIYISIIILFSGFYIILFTILNFKFDFFKLDNVVNVIIVLSAINLFVFPYLIIAKTIIHTEPHKDNTIKQKYNGTPLSDSDIERHWANLIIIIEQNKLYLNSDLSIKDLADLLNLPWQYLSVIINKKSKQNFYDFINYYRITEFKKLIQESDSKKNIYTFICIRFRF